MYIPYSGGLIKTVQAVPFFEYYRQTMFSIYNSHILRLKILLILNDGEFHFLFFFQRTVSLAANGVKVYENIVSSFSTDEAIALTFGKPLDCAGFSFFQDYLNPFFQN